MSGNHSFIIENEAERQRLRGLALIITNQQLALQLPNGWTVADTLVHLAFWDLRALAVLKRWKKDGFKPIPIDADTTNEAVNILAETIMPHAAVALAVYASGLIDKEIEGVSTDLIAAILNAGQERFLRRAQHRKEHLDKIEKVLKV
jgi:hypothetical protein